MLTVLPLRDKAEIYEKFNKYEITADEYSGCVVAESGSEILGECLYKLNEKGIEILRLEPRNDLALADGILRSALHVAAERSAMDARFSADAPSELFAKLGFIKNEQERTLDIDKLFGGCACHQK